MFRFLGIALMLAAVALVAVPTFTDCQSRGEAIQISVGGTTPMKCHWSGIAEIGVGIPLYVVGAVMTTNRQRKTLSVLSVLGIVLGGLAIAFPTGLIGVCQGPTMLCKTLMQPLLVSFGGLAIGVSALGLVMSQTAKSLSGALSLARSALSRRALSWKGV